MLELSFLSSILFSFKLSFSFLVLLYVELSSSLIKLCFDRMGYENKLYCCRSYEAEDNFDEDVRMHCFVLFKDNNSWYHFEHSSYLRRGIHKYET